MPTNHKTTNKKDLKNYINENGFFCGVEINEIKREEVKSLGTNSIKISNKIPEGDSIRIYKGLATQKFEGKDVSRNDYKIDVDGWDFSNYVNNPAILFQHNDNKPFGQAVEIMPHDKGIDLLFWVDLNALDEKEAYRVDKRLIKALSTGHITIESAFENTKTGERMTWHQMWKEMEDEDLDYVYEDYVYVVTKAEAIEISMVTLPSNPKALTVQNGIGHYYENTFLPKQQMEKNKLPPEDKKDLKTNVEKTEAPAKTEEKTEPAGKDPKPKEEDKTEAKKTEEKKVEASRDPIEESKTVVSKEEYDLIKELHEATKDEAEKKKLENVLASLTFEGQNPEAKKGENKTPEKVEKKQDTNFVTMDDLNGMVANLSEVIQNQNSEIEALKNALDKIPEEKGLIFNSQFEEKKGLPTNGLAAQLMKHLTKR